MRDLQKVIGQIQAVIPADETGFHQSLESCRSSAAFSSPEMMGIRWQKTAEVLMDHIPAEIEDMNDWQKRVICIWQGVNRLEDVHDAV